jgi:hypothetical protein
MVLLSILTPEMPRKVLDKVEEVTLDLSKSMNCIVKVCFPKASRIMV